MKSVEKTNFKKYHPKETTIYFRRSHSRKKKIHFAEHLIFKHMDF